MILKLENVKKVKKINFKENIKCIKFIYKFKITYLK